MIGYVRPTAIALAIALIAGSAPAFAQTPAAKTAVTDETQLPRYNYPLTLPPSQLLVADDAAFAPLAAAVGGDIDKTLAAYDIGDKATLSDFVSTKLALQMLAHDYDGVRQSVAALRADQTKRAAALEAGMDYLAYADAVKASGAATAMPSVEAFAAANGPAIDALPWDVVADSIKSLYSSDQIVTRDLIIGQVQHTFDPIAAKTGGLDGLSARKLVQLRALVLYALPFVPQQTALLKAYIDKNNVVKPDIWAARDVTIAPGRAKSPVLVGIWDSGVDPADYPDAMYVDARGRNGLAFADDGSDSASDLYPLPDDVAKAYPGLVKTMSGMSDLQLGLDTKDASDARTFVKSLSPADAAAYGHQMELVGEYAHGSHVAGIASRGNAAARIVVARFDDNIADLTFEPTTEWADKMAADFAKTGDYFRSHHVRVVNMSWGDQVSEFEDWLTRTDKNADPVARKAKAQALFAIWRKAIEDVIASNPETLFVTAAGNDDADSSFAVDVPSSLTYPNLITVGAVNQAGDPAGFTSYGSTVAVYADGYQVPSKIPGGYTVRESGTSMASPNVANLAAKLFALDPSLTAVRARALIIEGSTPSADGKRMLIDPKATVALLKK